MKLDLKRLHNNFLNKKDIGEGRTTDLLVAAIQSSESTREDQVIVIAHLRTASLITDMMTHLVGQVSNLKIEGIGRHYITLNNGTKLIVTNRLSRFNTELEWIDNSYYEANLGYSGSV